MVSAHVGSTSCGVADLPAFADFTDFAVASPPPLAMIPPPMIVTRTAAPTTAPAPARHRARRDHGGARCLGMSFQNVMVHLLVREADRGSPRSCRRPRRRCAPPG